MNAIESTDESQKRQKIFVGGLARETTDTSLELFFAQFGEIASAEVLRDHQTMNSRGFGFVTFRKTGIAEYVISLGTRRPFTINGKQVEVKSAVPREKYNLGVRRVSLSNVFDGISLSARSNSEPLFRNFLFNEAVCDYSDARSRRSSSPTHQNHRESNVKGKVFVGGLPYTTGHEGLRRCFERFGAVSSAEVIYNRETKKSRGFGFIIFSSKISVERVMLSQQLNPLVLDGKQVEVKPCKPKTATQRAETDHFESVLQDLYRKEYFDDSEQKYDTWCFNDTMMNFPLETLPISSFQSSRYN